jgi:hypothetical protein
MDFSLHEQRRLTQIEIELSADRKLVAALRILGARGAGSWRTTRYLAWRLRHPMRRRTQAEIARRCHLARLAVVVTLTLTVLVPVTLITALSTHLAVLALVMAWVFPLPPLLFLATRRWLRRWEGLRIQPTTAVSRAKPVDIEDHGEHG